LKDQKTQLQSRNNHLKKEQEKFEKKTRHGLFQLQQEKDKKDRIKKAEELKK
jgi:predicted RNA-binding protein YlxR (DUF448 family)